MNRHFMTPWPWAYMLGRLVGEGQGRHHGATWASRGAETAIPRGLPCRKEAARFGLAAGALMVSPVLGRKLVNALAVLALAGLELQAHFLAHLRAQEAPHAVRLPAGGLGEIRERRSFLAAQQPDNRGALAVARGLFHSHLLRLA